MEETSSSSERLSMDQQFALVEYTPLREEVNRTIDRMTANEVICGGFVFSVILIQITNNPEFIFPEFVINLAAAVTALAIAIGGENRSKVFRRHMDQVDSYLKTLENKFSPLGGWTSHYERTMKFSDDKRQIGTRTAFWHLLKFLAFANLGLQVAGLFATK